MGSIRKRGFELADGLSLFLSRRQDGRWTAWIERDSIPLETSPGIPLVFESDSAYQAQCKAVGWLRESAGMGAKHVWPPTLQQLAADMPLPPGASDKSKF